MTDILKLKKLRQETEVSLSMCKKALDRAGGNLSKAKKLLYKWGFEKASSKSEKIAAQGAIFSYVHHNQQVASLIELFCETDFVAANSEFKSLGHELAMQLASQEAKDVKQFARQVYNRDSSKKVADLINEAILKFGENIKIGRILRWRLGA